MINAYAAFEPEGRLEPFSYDPGKLNPDDVEIAVKYCGICHSDISIIDNEWGISQYPVVAGHEVIGEIIETGTQVTHLKKGQIVGLGWQSGYCNHCQQCLTGYQNLCAESQATIVGHYGGFADKVRAAANSVVPIPEGMSLASAGPLFCGGITVFNPIAAFNVKPTDKVAVIGIGGLGHLALQFLRAWGCEVTAFTSSEDKKQAAMDLGAHKTLNSRDEASIASAAGYFDFIISTVNVQLDWDAYIRTLAPKGRLHFVGVLTEPIAYHLGPLLSGQRSISASLVGSPPMIRTMLDFARRHAIEPVIEIYPFTAINDALDRLRSGKARYRIVLEQSDT